ncbi:hypothetical protein [Haloarchaeobius iranensis]|uniref:Type I restriction enzyme R protein N-terminal domain-containing protein n=1 Tax=Haloarchaeobius iranensis TaxID=996166 RepID=A0A1G9WNT6_9EURY|nr:hypothetical protein [Haloarchaeobius iranensis]SDM86198.1 hypothetical protein SAMN05192554_108173 [Haloarchaeobius iranensis]
MRADELASYVERAGSADPGAAELGLRNTQLRLVEPFLECLGWDVRSPSVEAAFAVDGTDAVVDYALLVDGVPAVFVDTLACESALDAADVETLLSAMDAADVEWGILTNGRRFAFVARREDGEDGFSCSLGELPSHAADLEQFTPERAAEYVQSRERRLAAAESIAARRTELVDALVAELRSAAGDEAAAVPDAPVRTATASFVDDVVETIAPDQSVVPSGGASGSGGRREQSASAADDGGADDSPSGTPSIESATSGAATQAGREPASTRTDGHADDPGTHGGDDHDVDGATHAPMTDDGEYVARLFKGRSSIGAVGGSSVAETMKATADYLLEQQHLDAGLSLPYVPNDGGRAVLNRVPRHPSGEPMEEYVTLDSGPYLWTAGALAERRGRIETLAREAGLRVMFQGDWKPR